VNIQERKWPLFNIYFFTKKKGSLTTPSLSIHTQVTKTDFNTNTRISNNTVHFSNSSTPESIFSERPYGTPQQERGKSRNESVCNNVHNTLPGIFLKKLEAAQM
jgi:hypothetical protein